MKRSIDIPIYFHFLSSITLKNRKQLKAFISQLFKQEAVDLETLNYIFCSDAYLLQINKTYLKHDIYTDIITFSLMPPNVPIVGDVYISTDRVKENASMYNISQTSEFHRVLFHGALHLCGYRDKTKADKQQMREKEDFYLNQYFVSRETL